MRTLVVLVGMLLLCHTAVPAQIPTEAELHKQAGNHHLKQRRYDLARDQYLASLRIAPDYDDVHYNLGILYFFRLDDHRRALYHLGRYAQLVSDAPDLDQVESLVRLALKKIEGQEGESYQKALKAGTAASLQAFLAANPASYYTADAERKIRQLRE